jgi:hypothetical protein
VETRQIRGGDLSLSFEAVRASSSVNKFRHSSSEIRTPLGPRFLLPRIQVDDAVGPKPDLQVFCPVTEVNRGDEKSRLSLSSSHPRRLLICQGLGTQLAFTIAQQLSYDFLAKSRRERSFSSVCF